MPREHEAPLASADVRVGHAVLVEKSAGERADISDADCRHVSAMMIAAANS